MSLDADASDVDLDTLTYGATGLPDGVSIDQDTGVISGTLTSSSAGTHNTVITVSDGSLTDTDSFTWTVSATNQAPVFSTDITDQTDAEGASVNLDANATDADLDTITYSATDLPGGATINPSTGVISGTLSSSSAGTHNVTVTVSDGSLTDDDSFTWTVSNTNQAPVFSTDITDQTDAEGDIVSLDADATDPDLDTITYSASNLPDGISINASTGVISGTLSSSSAGVHNVTVTASDGSLPDFDTFTWTVSATNQAPVFSTDITDQTDAEGASVSLDADATDADLDTITYSASNLPDGATINSSTGIISGTLSSSSAGVHNVTVTASDGTDEDTDSFTWTVTNTNQAPVFSTDIGNQSNAEGNNVNLDADATDPDGTAVTYSATGLPNGVGINSTTGVISGTLSFTSAGSHNVTITASDGSLTDTDSFTWTVSATNQAPVFSTDIGNQSNAEGNNVNLDADATDPDGTAVTYSATGLPNGVGINSSTGVISGTLSFTSAGSHNVTITASDGSLTDTDSFTWTVANSNQPPVFSTEFGDRTDAEGAAISLDANATDPDAGTTLVYSATGLPGGITINSSTGVFSGTLNATSSGTYNTVITVSDGSLTDTDSFTWTVTEPVVNQPPVFSTEFGDRTDAEGAAISLDANATDPDAGTTLVYSATGLPGGITINSSTGVFSGTLNATSSGTYNTVITVSDGSLTDTDSFTWTVTEPNPLIIYVDDTFTRTSSSSWGSATPTGGAYTLSGTAANFAVSGGIGSITMPTAGITRGALLNTPSATDVDVSFRVRTDKLASGGHQYIYGVVRRNGTNEYRVKIRLATNGTVYVSGSQVIANVESSIGGEVLVPGLSHSANTFIRFRAQVTGTNPTTLRIRAWADAAVEPTTWNYTQTNSNASLQGTGTLGLRTYVASGTNNSPVVFGFDDYRVTSLGGPNQPPVFSTEFGDRTDAEGAAISLDANATDPDAGTTLVYSATGLPGGITINSSTGVFSGTLNATSSGTYNTVITVSDGSLTDTDSFTWTVTEPVVNQPPVFSTEFGDRTDAEGAAISLDANATDPDAGTTLVYSATGLPGGITINSSTGVFSGTLNATSSGTYNTVITVSDGSLTDTDSFTWTVTEPNPLIIYVDDTFTRTSSSSWGSATPTGGAYTLSGTAANFAVSGGIGSITMPTAGITRGALLNTPSATDVDVSFRVRTDKLASGGHQYIYGVVRRNGTNEYRVKIRLATNGTVYVSGSQVIANVESSIGGEVLVPGLSHSANTFIRFRAQVTGTNPTTLRIRAWADAAVEPTTWNYTQTNSNASLQGTGTLGLRTYVASGTNNSPVVFGFDDYRVTSLGGP